MVKFRNIKLFIGKCFSVIVKYCNLCMYFLHQEDGINIETLRSLKNKYLGQRCFIVCTGPSLKKEDLDVLYNNEEITFSCNKIDKIFEQTKWRPTFYCVTDEHYQHTLLDTMNIVPSIMQFYSKESFLTTRKCKNPHVWLNTHRRLQPGKMFSYDLTDHINDYGTVTYDLIQLAVYLGFKYIYIIGCDHSYARQINKDGSVSINNSPSYFSGSDSENQEVLTDVGVMDIAYEQAKLEMEKGAFKIFNATRGGKLEYFPRVEFDSLFNSNI